MADNTLPNTPMPGQTFSGGASPRQLSRHGSASTPSHNNRYVGQPANPMRRSPERDAMLAATASRTNTPPRQMRGNLQNQFLGPQFSENQSPERAVSHQPVPSGRPPPIPSILDTHRYLKCAAKNPPTPLSPHATPFFSTGQGQSSSNLSATRSQSVVNPPNKIPQSTANTSNQDSGNGPNVQTAAQQAFNPYVNNDFQHNTSQPMNQPPSSKQPENQSNTGPFQANNVHQTYHHQPYQPQGDTQTPGAHIIHSFTSPQRPQQGQQRQPGFEPTPNNAPSAPTYQQQHLPNYNNPNYPQNNKPHQDPHSYTPETTTTHHPPPNPQQPPPSTETQPANAHYPPPPTPHQPPSTSETPHANTLTNLRSTTRLSSTHLALPPPKDPTLRRTEACTLLTALETDKKMLIRSRKKTYAEIRDLEELLWDFKGKRDALVARKDWEGGEEEIMEAEFEGGEVGFEGGEGGGGGKMTIGQQIFALERELGGVIYYHEEYGRMYQAVADNIERMWEAVAQPEAGWED
ncbi:MAG: hypothetical protein Q9195_004667 [Heterodermia aff. obscurata]